MTQMEHVWLSVGLGGGELTFRYGDDDYAGGSVATVDQDLWWYFDEVGDMATTSVEGTFGLVYLVYNTITNLLTQDGQVAVFRNAAAHLAIGGHSVVEVSVPALRRLPVGESPVAFDVFDGHVGVDEYDVVSQRLTSHHYWTKDGRAEVFDSPHRYVWPAELDLMARITGLTLVERWSDWQRTPFTADSTSHVSVWEKANP